MEIYKNNEKVYKIVELYNNSELINIFKEIPFVYTNKQFKFYNIAYDNYTDINQIFTYEGLDFFKNIIDDDNNLIDLNKFSFKKNFNFNYEDIDNYTNNEKFVSFETLKFDNNSVNNTILVYLNIDIKNIISNNIESKNKDKNQLIIKNKTNLYKYLKNSTCNFKFTEKEFFENKILQNRKKFNYDYVSGYLNENNYQYYEYFSKKIKEENNDYFNKNILNNLMYKDLFTIKNISCKNILFDVYDISLNLDINIINLFKEIETSQYIPIIKYVSNGEIQLYNIYKPFFRNIDTKDISTFLLKKDRISELNLNITSYQKKNIRFYKLKYLINKDYIQFKVNINPNNIVNIYLFENGYILCEYQTLKYIDKRDIINYLVFINKLIKKIKNKYKMNYLPLVNPENLFKNTIGALSYCKLINNELIYKFDLKNNFIENIKKIYKFDKELVKKINEDTVIYKDNNINLSNVFLNFFKKLNKLNNVLITSRPNLENLEIGFIYNITYGFYSADNIKAYINRYFKKKNNKISKKEKKILYEQISKIFNIENDKIDELYKIVEQSDNEESNVDFIYYIFCIFSI